MQIGFGGLLFVVFLILKLTGTIAWSWVWVTAPLWISFLLAFVLFVVGAIIVTKAGSKAFLKSPPFIR